MNDRLGAQVADAFGKAAAIGRKTATEAVGVAADSALRGWRGAKAVGEAQRAYMRGLNDKPIDDAPTAAALEASSAAAVGGIEAALEAVVGYARSATDENFRILERALAAESPKEWLDIQVEAGDLLLKRSLAHGAALNRIAADTLAGTMKPITARWSAAEAAAG